MALAGLDQLVQFYFKQALAPATSRSYEAAKKRFLAFCQSVHLPSVPASEAVLLRFVVALAAEGLSSGTIKCYLSGVRHLYLSLGLGDPKVGDMATLQHVMRGIKSVQAKRGQQPRPRLPITPTILSGLRQVWEKSRHDFDNIMLWAACTTCFFGFLRSGEITSPSAHDFDPTYHLSLTDIAVDNPSHPLAISVYIKASKTDPFRKGVQIFLGRTNDHLCPVAAMLAYVAIHGRQPGPLFRLASGAYLTRDRFVREVRKALTAAGLDQSKYAGHSFRIGAATTAAAVGIEDSTIKTLGRWESAAYQLYVRLPREVLTSVSSKLVKAAFP